MTFGKYIKTTIILIMRISSPLCYFISLMSKIFFSTLFSDTHNLCSFLEITDRLSHPYKFAGKTMYMYMYIYIYIY
jgi:hypothetical protein